MCWITSAYGLSVSREPAPRRWPTRTQQAAVHAVAAQERNAARLIRVPGAIGHAVGLTTNGVAIKVYVAEMSDRARQAIPNQIEGVPVVLEAVGPVKAIGSMGTCVKRSAAGSSPGAALRTNDTFAARPAPRGLSPYRAALRNASRSASSCLVSNSPYPDGISEVVPDWTAAMSPRKMCVDRREAGQHDFIGCLASQQAACVDLISCGQ